MRCKKCGALLLDTDTYCGKCGAKVEIDICPKCGETLRPGMSFCAKCGAKVLQVEKTEAEDDEIPVTGQITTTDIPFDIIEANIISDVQRQLDVPTKKESSKTVYKKSPVFEQPEDDEYEDDDEYDQDEYDRDDEYDEEDYPEEDYEEEDDEDEEPSVFSRLITAGMIVAGLVLILIAAVFFFNSRKNTAGESENTAETESEATDEDESEQEEEQTGDEIIGTITVISNVNIRDNPSKDNSEVIGLASTGEQYSYYGYGDASENWVHIKVNDSTDGYVYKDYVQIDQ